MSDAPEVEEVEVPAEAAEAASPEVDFQSAARKGGWLPKDEFKGDPEKWVDAPQFVLRAAEILPQLTSDLKDAKSEIRAVQKTLRDFGEHHTKTEQRAYQRALADIQARIDSAAAQGDVEGVRAGTEELVELRSDAASQTTPQEPEPEWFADWKSENPWFGKERIRTAATVAAADELMAEGYSGRALAKAVDARLREEFPHKYENPNRRQAPGVEGGGSPPKPKGKSYSDLPQDAKEICDDFVKRGVLTRDRYVKDYFQ